MLDRLTSHMKPRSIQFLSLSFAFSFAVGICTATEGRTNDSDAIQFGIPRSTLIISGEFLVTFSGGGGANSTVKVDKVFKAPQKVPTPTEIHVYWTTLKKDQPLAQMNTNTFLFFLQRVIADGPTTYRDVTGESHPFVRASEANIRLLSSKLTEKK